MRTKYNFDYGRLRVPNTGIVTVWVLRASHGGYEYLVADSPTLDQMPHVLARIGPIAWEDGQGLAPVREQLEEGIKLSNERQQGLAEHERIKELIHREVAARMPKPQEATEASLEGKEPG